MNSRTKLVAVVIVALLALSTVMQAETRGYDRPRPRIRLPKVATAPRLSDYLDGNTRSEEFRIANFQQREPNDGAPATLQTAVYLSYDQKNLYAIFVCTEDPRKVRAHLSRRDDLTDDDEVTLTLDTFHDGRRAYEFFSNPLGVQKDAITTEGQDEDFSFDALWRSEGRLTSTGYVVWLAIPFKSLRFNPAVSNTWGIALGRYTPGIKELATWPHLTEKIEAYVPQLATLEAVGETSAGHNMQFIPYTSFSGQHFLNTPEGAAPGFKTQNDWRGGVDGKLVVHDALTFDFTVNPDFSQVESDEPQVTINQRYEVFFPEKRPFFTESAGFFQTPETLFFSRRIGDPQVGLRMTGKLGPWALGMLGMDDRAPGQFLTAGDPLSGQRAHVAVFRAQREVGKESTIGFFFSRRNFASSSNDIFSLDTRLKINANWVFTGQAVHSGAQDLTGEHFSGSDYFAEIRHSGLHLSYYTNYLDRSPNFRADLGFIPRVDIRQVKNVANYQWRPKIGPLVSFGPTVRTRGIWDHRGQLQDWLVDVPFTLRFKGPTSVSVGRLEEYELFQNIGFRENASYIDFSTQKLRWMGIDSSYVHGTNINYFPASGIVPFLAASDDATLSLTFRPTSCARIEETYIYDRLGTFAGSHLASTTPQGAVFNNHLLRTKVSYQFTRALSLRAILDYNAVLSAPSLVDLDRSKRVTGDVLLTYLLNPGTAIYVGYTDRRENLAFDPGSTIGLRRTAIPGLETGRQFFVKVSYLFRF